MTNGASDPLEQRIKQHYQQQELPLDVLVDLKEAIGSVSVGRVAIAQEQRPRRPLVKMQALVRPIAVFAVILFCIGLTAFLFRQQTSHRQLEAVATEIALNHAKQFDVEFSTPSIASLTGIMPLLDFAPVHPRRMQLDTYHIVGARYCTIDSSIAVQVHLEDDTQRAYTLYEFRAPTSLSIDDETVINVGDIQVTLWQENGVTLGLAHREY